MDYSHDTDPPNGIVITGIVGKGSIGMQSRAQAAKGPRWVDLKKGEPVKDSIANIRAFLRYVGVKLWLNEFEKRILIDGRADKGQHLNTHVLHSLWCQANELGYKPSIGWMRQVFLSIALENARHPLRDFLNALSWDGIERAERLFIDYANAEDNALNRAIGKLLLVAMVRRIFKPGCKFDYMVILQGPQGGAKSMFCKILAGGSEYYEECVTLTDSVEKVIENTAGKWVVESAELVGLTKKDIERQKALITRTVDRCRLAYAREVEDAPRAFVLIGTTNEEAFLCDSTGNRRYLPIRVKDIDYEALERDREQLLAEACKLEKTHGPLILPAELKEEVRLRQEEVTIPDAAVERLSDFISDKLAADPHHVFLKEGLFSVMGVTKATSEDGKVLARVTRQFGLKPARPGPKGGKRPRCYIREEAAEAEDR